MPEELRAEQFIEQLEAHRSAEGQQKIQRYFKSGAGQASGAAPSDLVMLAGWPARCRSGPPPFV
jgi:hypothetical protein